MDYRQNCAGDVFPYSVAEPVLESARMGIWVWNVVTNAVRYSLRLAHILGCPVETLGRDMTSMRTNVYTEDIEKAVRHLDKCLWGDTGWHEEFFRWTRKDGGITWTRELCTVTDRSDDGIPLVVYGILNHFAPQEAQRTVPAMNIGGADGWKKDFADHSNVRSYAF